MNTKTIRIGLVLAAAVLVTAARANAQTKPAGTWEPAGKAVVEEPKKDAPAKTPAAEPQKDAPAGAKAPAATQGAPTRPAPPAGPCGGQMDWTIWAMMGGMVVLFMFMGRGKKKQEAARREMLSNIKKGDRITSIGGIIGTVMDVREDEVVVKVDDETRIHLARWAVRGVGEASKAENPEQAKKQQEKDKK